MNYVHCIYYIFRVSLQSNLWRKSGWYEDLGKEKINKLESIFNDKCDHLIIDDNKSTILLLDKLKISYNSIEDKYDENLINRIIKKYNLSFIKDYIILSDFCFLYYKVYFRENDKNSVDMYNYYILVY